MYGTLNGVYRMKEGKMHIHTFDTHSNGDIVMAIGTIDLIEGKASLRCIRKLAFRLATDVSNALALQKATYPRQPIRTKRPVGWALWLGADSWCPGEDPNLTPLRALAPEASVSTNFTTWAAGNL